MTPTNDNHVNAARPTTTNTSRRVDLAAVVEQTADTLLEARAVADLAGRDVTLADLDNATARHFGDGIGHELAQMFFRCEQQIDSGAGAKAAVRDTLGEVAMMAAQHVLAALLPVEYLAGRVADLEGSDPAAVLRGMVEEFRAGQPSRTVSRGVHE